MKYFKEALKKTLGHEGGYSDDPADSGGRTNYGITEGLAKEYGYTGEMRNLNLAETDRIYYEAFWRPLNL